MQSNFDRSQDSAHLLPPAFTSDMTSPHTPPTRRATLEKYLTEDPQNELLLLDLAGECYAEEDFVRALELAATARRKSPDNARASSMTCLCLLAMGRTAEASRTLREALPRAQTTTEARQLLWPFARNGLVRASLDTADVVLRHGGLHDDTRLALIKAIHFAGDTQRALVRLLEALTHSEATPEHDALAALLYFDTQQFDLARVHLGRCASHPFESVETLYVEASIDLLDGKLTEALPKADRALAMSPTDGRCVALKGQLVMADRRLDEALILLQQAVELMPEHIGSWHALGWCHYFSSKPDEARRAFSHALNLDHNFAESHGALAVVNASEGRIALAEESIKRANRIDPKNLSARLARILLTQRRAKPNDALHESILAELGRIAHPQGGTLQQFIRHFGGR